MEGVEKFEVVVELMKSLPVRCIGISALAYTL
jgi:hypothetical protein